MGKHLPMIIIPILLILGLGLLFYPDISSWHNARIQRGLTQAFDEEVATLSQEYIDDHFYRARAYNNTLNGLTITDPFIVGSGAIIPPARYMETLNIGGMMARIAIPIIDVDLPVFHTTNMDILDRGVGHIEGTSFPVGGLGSHAVLTGHSGLAHARMFTDLEAVSIGDLFFITVLNYTMAYEIDQIITVLPHEIDSLRIDGTADFVTLVTCTPYAINSHRLLVRGARVPYQQGMDTYIESILETIAPGTDFRLVAIVAMGVLFLLVVVAYEVTYRKRKAQRSPL